MRRAGLAAIRREGRAWFSIALTLAWLCGVRSDVHAQGAPGPQRGRDAPGWTLGSTAEEVSRAEGDADRVDLFASLGYRVWHYGQAWVRIALSDDTVIGWWNPGARLAVYLRPGADTSAGVARASTLSDVVRLRGTPDGYTPDRLRGVIVLRYGAASLVIDAATRGVVGPLAAESGASEGVRLPGEARSKDAPRGPATLRAQAALATAGRDGRVDADGSIALDITVSNGGPATARMLTLSAKGTGAAVQPNGAWPSLDSLAAGAAHTFRLALGVGDVPRDTVLDIVIAISEAARFDLDPPLRVRVPLGPALPPRLVLKEVAVEGRPGESRIEPRQVVDIAVRIENAGEGQARDVRAIVVPGTGIHLVPGARDDSILGAIAPGDTRDLRFSAFSDSRAVGFPVTLLVREARARFDTSFTLPLVLDRTTRSRVELLRPPDSPLDGRRTAPALVSSVDTGVPRAALRPGTVAVVLGVEQYERAPAAHFAQRDAAVFREYARALFGTGDDASRLFYGVNEEVSLSTMRKLFDPGGWLARRADATTDVVVFIASHGTVDVKARAAYLLPSDADPAYPAQTGVALDSLLDRLGALPARSVTVFLDACFSGTTRDGSSLVPWTRDVSVSIEHPALKYPNMVVLAAAGAGETAMEWAQQRHGLFTYWLLDGMRGAADANHDGIVDAGELGDYVARRVRTTAAEIGREQSPQLITRNRRTPLVWLPPG